jgi:uncharacterized integral membrane protein
MRIFVWLLRGVVFLILLAFALNNQQIVTVHGFFGTRWQAPLVIVVLASVALGTLIGIAGMLQGRWRQRRTPADTQTKAARNAQPAAAAPTTESVPEHPPRDGL